MILKSLNKLDTKFGFPNEVQYENPEFHGHQKGMCLGIKDLATGVIEHNYLSSELENRDALLEELLSTEGILIVEDRITQLNEKENQLEQKAVYYLPYAVMDHSIFQPTLNDINVETTSSNVTNRFEVEILFVQDGLNRYVTVPFETRNVSMFESVNNMFDEVFFGDHFDENHELYRIGVRWVEDSEEYGSAYLLDFYNEAGQTFYLGFTHMSDLKDAIASVRLLSSVLIIDKEGE